MVKLISAVNSNEATGMATDQRVDLIYRWINPHVGKMKLEQSGFENPQFALGDMTCMHRYRDNNELRYSLRSIARHAAWVGAIHIIGEGEPPDWLRIEPPIFWVDHHSFLMSCGQQPQANSETQKLYFSSVPNLAERFICFDDDWFLGTRAMPGDFFTQSGMPIQPSMIHLRGGHAPLAWTRTLYDHVLGLLPRELVLAVKNGGAFRIDPMQKMREYSVQAGLVATSKERDAQIWLRDLNVKYYQEVLASIIEREPTTFCINDDWSFDESNYRQQMLDLVRFFEGMYPNVAPWELMPCLVEGDSARIPKSVIARLECPPGLYGLIDKAPRPKSNFDDVHRQAAGLDGLFDGKHC